MLLETLFSLLGAIIAVVAIIALSYWFTKHVAGSGILGGVRTGSGAGPMKILAQLGVGKEQRLLVAAVGERYFLLGVTPAGISQLAELTEEEVAVWRQEESNAPPTPPGFRDALRSYLEKKR